MRNTIEVVTAAVVTPLRQPVESKWFLVLGPPSEAGDRSSMPSCPRSMRAVESDVDKNLSRSAVGVSAQLEE